MSKWIQILTLFALVIMVMGCASGSSGGGTEGSGGVIVRGITQDDSNKPIAGVVVTVLDVAGVPLATTTTGSDGAFSLPNLAVKNGDVRFEFPDKRGDIEVAFSTDDTKKDVEVTVQRDRSGKSKGEVKYRESGSHSDEDRRDDDAKGDDSKDESKDDSSENEDSPSHHGGQNNSGNNGNGNGQNGSGDNDSSDGDESSDESDDDEDDSKDEDKDNNGKDDDKNEDSNDNEDQKEGKGK